MSTRWAKGSSPTWRRIRLTVLERDQWRCKLAIPGICTSVATQVHHTRPREIAGDDPAHLIATCMPCNQRVGDPTRHDPKPRPSRW